MMLFALAPVLCWFLLFVLAYTFTEKEGTFTRLRIALLTSTVLHGLLVAAITEGLSAFSLIRFGYLLLSWLLILLVLMGICLSRGINLKKVKEIVTAAINIHRFGWMVWVMTIFILVSLILALIYPPNNYDSMTYHMARVAHWVQNQNVSYYQTHILRQLVYPPFAEWNILHFQVLIKSDMLANSVQLFYFIGCISTISLITKALGGTVKQQLASAFYTTLIPMAIIQSNTTQNDIVVAFFVTAFAYFTVLLFRKTTPLLIVLAGSSLGLAILTKGTGFIFVAPFCAWYLIALMKDYRQPFRKILRKAVLYSLIPLMALLINSGYFYRNIFLNGSPLGNTNKDTGNQGMEIKPIMFVAIKNFMNHLPVTGNMKAALKNKATAVGVDIDDPKYNFVPTALMYDAGIIYHEDYMQNYPYVILILLFSLLFFLRKDLYKKRISEYTLFVFSITAAVMLFCILLKWQPWSNRLQTALFMLYCVFLTIEIGKYNRWVQFASYVPVIYYAVGALFSSANHPFPYKKKIYDEIIQSGAINRVARECSTYLSDKPYTSIGLYIGEDSWDYPYFRYLANSAGKSRTINHVFVNNESAKYHNNFTPDAIISAETSRDNHTLNGVIYERTKNFKDGMALFERK